MVLLFNNSTLSANSAIYVFFSFVNSAVTVKIIFLQSSMVNIFVISEKNIYTECILVIREIFHRRLLISKSNLCD